MKTITEMAYWLVALAWLGLVAFGTWYAVDQVRLAEGITLHIVMTVALGLLGALQTNFFASMAESWIAGSTDQEEPVK